MSWILKLWQQSLLHLTNPEKYLLVAFWIIKTKKKFTIEDLVCCHLIYNWWQNDLDATLKKVVLIFLNIFIGDVNIIVSLSMSETYKYSFIVEKSFVVSLTPFSAPLEDRIWLYYVCARTGF